MPSGAYIPVASGDKVPLTIRYVGSVATAETAAGVTEFEAELIELVPSAFTAATVNEYGVPLVSQLMRIGEPVDVAVIPPLVDEAI